MLFYYLSKITGCQWTLENTDNEVHYRNLTAGCDMSKTCLLAVDGMGTTDFKRVADDTQEDPSFMQCLLPVALVPAMRYNGNGTIVDFRGMADHNMLLTKNGNRGSFRHGDCTRIANMDELATCITKFQRFISSGEGIFSESMETSKQFMYKVTRKACKTAKVDTPILYVGYVKENGTLSVFVPEVYMAPRLQKAIDDTIAIFKAANYIIEKGVLPEWWADNLNPTAIAATVSPSAPSADSIPTAAPLEPDEDDTTSEDVVRTQSVKLKIRSTEALLNVIPLAGSDLRPDSYGMVSFNHTRGSIMIHKDEIAFMLVEDIT